MRILIVALAAALLAGCQFGGPPRSGFLDDYSGLAPAPDGSGAWSWRAEDFDFNAFTAFMVEPVEVWIVPDDEDPAVSQAELVELGSHFRRAVREALLGSYTVVDEAGPGVLRLRSAITRVRRVSEVAGLAEYETSLEAKMIDGGSGRTVVRFSDRRLTAVEASATGWRRLRPALDHWAGKLRQAIDEARY